MSSKQVFIDNLPFIRSSQTVRRINTEDGPWLNENNEDITLDLHKSTTFPWEAVGHARRTGPRGHQVQVEYLPKEQMYKSVDNRSLARRNICNTPLIPDQKEKQIPKQIFSVGPECVTLEDLPHPSKLTKKKKHQQKKYSKLDLGKMYALQLKKKLEQFNWPSESVYQKKDSNTTNYSEEMVFEPSTLCTNDGEEQVQQVLRTPTLRNSNNFSLVELPSVMLDKSFSISPSCYKDESHNSRTPTRYYHEEHIPWSRVSQSHEWLEGDQLPLISSNMLVKV